MFGLPTGELLAVTKDGKEESFEFTDCCSKQEIINEYLDYVEFLKKHNNDCYKNWVKLIYRRNRHDKTKDIVINISEIKERV